MPDERGGEVLRGSCTLALGDEPLMGGVEYAALEVRVEPSKLVLALKVSPRATLGHSGCLSLTISTDFYN